MQPDQHRKRSRSDHDRELAADQKQASIDDVHQRAGRNCEQRHRQAVGDLNHRYDERVRIEARHQPAGSDVVHPAADVRDDGRRHADDLQQLIGPFAAAFLEQQASARWLQPSKVAARQRLVHDDRRRGTGRVTCRPPAAHAIFEITALTFMLRPNRSLQPDRQDLEVVGIAADAQLYNPKT